MALDVQGILDAVASHALASGYFERVNTHEPANAPGYGLTAAVWVDRMDTVLSSGLASTTGRLVFNIRLYTSMQQEPADAIDPNMTAAADALFRAYIGDFTLGGLVRQVDVRGSTGSAWRRGRVTSNRTACCSGSTPSPFPAWSTTCGPKRRSSRTARFSNELHQP